jgi:hypothetical protein
MSGYDASRLQRAIAEYCQSWAVADSVLLNLCRTYPAHNVQSHVNAKLLIIGRAYATGVERKIKSSGSQGSSLSQLSAHLVERARRVDAEIARLPADQHRLCAEALEPIMAAHGACVAMLAEITRNKQSARSFVSKYLHFHRPIVPLYDSYAESAARCLVRWQSDLEVVPMRPEYDAEYYWYLMRFWRLYNLALSSGVQPTVKELDYYLLCEVDHGWTGGRLHA